MKKLPLFLRKFIVDAVETGIGALFAVQFVLPTTIDEAARVGAVIGAAVAGGVISAARRALPGLVSWLKDYFELKEDWAG